MTNGKSSGPFLLSGSRRTQAETPPSLWPWQRTIYRRSHSRSRLAAPAAFPWLREPFRAIATSPSNGTRYFAADFGYRYGCAPG